MKISTTRFGELEVDKKDILNFKEGPLGFENYSKFFLVDPGDQTLIIWLQSVDNPSIAFPVIEPQIFCSDYSLSLLPSELNSLELENVSGASVYTILTIPQNVTEMSANLKAPIIINNAKKIARQIVLQDNKLEVKHPMYTDLKKHIVKLVASDDSKRSRTTIRPIAETTANSETETRAVNSNQKREQEL